MACCSYVIQLATIEVYEDSFLIILLLIPKPNFLEMTLMHTCNHFLMSWKNY